MKDRNCVSSCPPKWLSFLALALFLFIPGTHDRFDIWPKPSMEFEFEHETDSPLRIVGGTLFECSQPDCSDAKPLESLGPQHFTCEANRCSSMAYGYSEYHRLAIQFSDGKTRHSNVFERHPSFSTTYRVVVWEDELAIGPAWVNPDSLILLGFMLAPIFGPLGLAMFVLMVIVIIRAGEGKADFNASRWLFVLLWLAMGLLLVLASCLYLAVPITLAIEGFLALLYAIIRKRSKITTLTMVALANMITVPILWMGASMLVGENTILFTAAAEVLIWIVESVIFCLTQRDSVRFREMLLLSLILNGCSYLIGLLLVL
jgi:hypothetical protein